MTTKRLNPTPQLFLVLQQLPAKERRKENIPRNNRPAAHKPIQSLSFCEAYNPAQQTQAQAHFLKTALRSNPAKSLHNYPITI